MPLPISCFIIAKNEADRIAVTINSVKDWVSEVVVIDSGSTDNTVNAALLEGARVLHHDWQGYGIQKRFGEDQCHELWLLNLDADEEISAELRHEINALFSNGTPTHQGYYLPVTHLLKGEKKRPPITQVNTVLRLYHREYGRFSDHLVHDSVIMVKGSAATLQSPVWHRSFRSLAHAVEKLNAYSELQAASMTLRRGWLLNLRLYAEFPACFIKAYLFRGYWLRGHRGFSYAMVYAFSRFIRLAKYLERCP